MGVRHAQGQPTTDRAHVSPRAEEERQCRPRAAAGGSAHPRGRRHPVAQPRAAAPPPHPHHRHRHRQQQQQLPKRGGGGGGGKGHTTGGGRGTTGGGKRATRLGNAAAGGAAAGGGRERWPRRPGWGAHAAPLRRRPPLPAGPQGGPRSRLQRPR
ncbi:hypothetical protein I4F81_005517 [Pyropia yezoensis]|uniref:Uncharacterized protein n=1 Tax=Pyropia yezoensis TaxID=2788 RepID=A0ACC3BY36_PYRYE|nr:hypothetical protein I4F81_005517 [Neopyropia yezoensis]